MRVAELHETRAFGVFHHAALKRNRAQFVGLSAAWPHCSLLAIQSTLLEHDPKKWKPVFGRDHAQLKAEEAAD
jgi:hypothetical protein